MGRGRGRGRGKGGMRVGPNPAPGHHDGSMDADFFAAEVVVANFGRRANAHRLEQAWRATARSVGEKGRRSSERLDWGGAHADPVSAGWALAAMR